MTETSDGRNFPAMEIFYILALPDWKPHETTPFQGFAPGLLNFVPCLHFIPNLPPDILDPTFEERDRLGRRRAGLGPWLWSPINLKTLLSKRKPTSYTPFMVIFSADKKTAKAVSTWRRSLRIRPIHLSYIQGVGAINPAEFTQEMLRQRLIALAQKAASLDEGIYIDDHLKALRQWKKREQTVSSLHFHSHNVTKPNEMALIGAGEAAAQSEAGHLNVSPADDYVRGITESTEAVMTLWSKAQNQSTFPVNPLCPDIFIFAPSMYRGTSKRMERSASIGALKQALRALDRQREYTMTLHLDDTDEAASEAHMNEIGPALALRGAEMKLTTAAVGLRTAGTIAATVRLPPAVNRTGGVVNQLARFLRKHENPPPVKSARVFRAVQDALRKSIPKEHLDLITRSKAGIKIIADSPIEWLPVEGLPLGIRYDVSRINTTPGNLFVEQIRAPIRLAIPPAAFRNYLVLSMFEEGDKISDHLKTGLLSTLDGHQQAIIGKFASPRTIEQFTSAIADFRGPILIIDSHAQHLDGDGPGSLIINGTPFDIWSLVGKIEMPPIVILSACDTHPFDRSHATVGNGFLACGATAVVATALPIRARPAARRAVHFGDILNGMGRAVPWTHIVGGTLRMEIATDIIRSFQAQGFYDESKVSDLLLQSNKDLNPLNPDWYELFTDRVFAACNTERGAWETKLADAIASSDAIRYLHLGNPESIMVADNRAK